MSLSGSTRSHLTPRPSSASGLWGHLMRSTVSQAPSSTTTTSSTTLGRHATPVAPLDKAGASTRILLHDTQAHLEKFTERVGVLATGFENAKQELSTVQKLYHDEHEQLVDRMIGLANRCQTELQKTIGNPAQTADVREVSKDLSTFATRLEALDKKIDTLNVLNQTQFQALQSIQDQQGQILAALLPILPLLQAVPLHIENARNQIKDSVSELQHHVSVREHLPAVVSTRNTPQSTKRARSHSLDPVNPAASPTKCKKRRLDEPSDITSITPDVSGALREQASPAIPPDVEHIPAKGASPEIPLSSLITRSSRKTVVRSPLADLVFANHRSAASVDLNKALLSDHARDPAIKKPAGPLVTGPVPGFSGSWCTPSRGRTSSVLQQKCGPAPNVLATPGPPGGQKSLLSSVNHTPQSRQPSRHPSHAAEVPDVHGGGGAFGTPVFRRGSTIQSSPANVHKLHRTPTARLDIGKGNTPGLVAQIDMQPPYAPPSASKPMSLKDRRALLSLSEDVVRNEGKRFIPLDDEDDEEIELVE